MAKQMQMQRAEAAVLEEVRWQDLESGFFRRRGNESRVWYAGLVGRTVFPFPVLENGDISKHSSSHEELSPLERIDVLDPASLNIASLNWSDDEAA